MRIQHNIPAMSSYRNYSRNVSAVNKNLEKLSSGYKINRAGDDAAGLAISEKMRLQISGLEQAQNNAKSGINLVQTAEGALTEVHDMLNRMYTLAEQSANGTYSDDVDREQLQKEVDSLRTEINRIADATNYNGIKLLNGDLDSKATAASTTWSDPKALDIGSDDAAHTGKATAAGHVVHKDGVDRAEPTFTVDLSGVEFKASKAGGFEVTIGGAKIAVSTKDGTNNFTAGDTLSGKALADAIAAAVNATSNAAGAVKDSTGTDSTGAVKGVKIGDNVFKATAQNDGSLLFELQTVQGTADPIEQQISDGTKELISQANITFDNKSQGEFTGLDAGGHANTKINVGTNKKAGEMAHATFALTDKEIADGAKLTIGKETYIFQIGKESKVTKDNAGDAKIIDLSDVDPTDTNLVNKAIAKLTNEDNSWFRLESGASGFLTAVEKADADGKSLYEGEGDITTKDGLQSNFSISTMTYAAASEGDASKALTLQIGDTADDYNKLTVSIKDMHAVGMGIDKIDISTQKGASDAMKAIQNATNYVSDVRGSLGALQNRLDHTINNLSVTQENIQDAESTIRDVDIAKEMMAYTKNNILVQSAQAMLAQANQLPQGVLQLLG